jgi:hypothetical protein
MRTGALYTNDQTEQQNRRKTSTESHRTPALRHRPTIQMMLKDTSNLYQGNLPVNIFYFGTL